MAEFYPLYDGSDPFESLRNEGENADALDEEQVRLYGTYGSQHVLDMTSVQQ
jgi:hypothetical protein